MKTKEEMKRLLDDLIEEVNNDPVAQREIARLKQGEGGFLRQLSELSFQDHQAEMRAQERIDPSPMAVRMRQAKVRPEWRRAPAVDPSSAVVRAEKARRAAGVATEPARKVAGG